MSPNSSRYAWTVVALLWVVALLNYLDRQVIFSIFPLLQTEMKLTNLELGLLGTSFLWVYAICSSFSGFLADRFGRKRVILGSLVIWSVITWATGYARNLPELMWARGLMGVSEACYLPAALALIASHHDERTRSKATGLHYSGIYAGIIFGGVGGGWVAQNYGWRTIFTLLGVFGVAYTLVLLPLLREEKVEAASRAVNPLTYWRSTRELFATPGFPVMMLVFATVSIANWLIYTWMPLFLYQRFQMNLASAGFSATFYMQAGSIAGILFGGWLADRWGLRVVKGRAFTQTLGLAAAAPFLFLAGVSGSAAFVLVGLAVFGIGRGMYDCNGMPVLCQFVRPELRSTGYGLLNLAGTFAGGTVAAAAGAFKSSIGLETMIQIAGGLLLVAAFLLTRLPKS